MLNTNFYRSGVAWFWRPGQNRHWAFHLAPFFGLPTPQEAGCHDVRPLRQPSRVSLPCPSSLGRGASSLQITQPQPTSDCKPMRRPVPKLSS